MIFLSSHYQCSMTWHMLGSCSPCDCWDCWAYHGPSAAYHLWFVLAVQHFESAFFHSELRRACKVLWGTATPALRFIFRKRLRKQAEVLVAFCHPLDQKQRTKCALKHLEKSLQIPHAHAGILSTACLPTVVVQYTRVKSQPTWKVLLSLFFFCVYICGFSLSPCQIFGDCKPLWTRDLGLDWTFLCRGWTATLAEFLRTSSTPCVPRSSTDIGTLYEELCCSWVLVERRFSSTR